MKPGRIITLVLLLLSLLVSDASALQYYDPALANATLGISRPEIAMRFMLDPGEVIRGASMTIDGNPATAAWDDTGLVHYTPAQPLAAGTHKVVLTVQISNTKQGWDYGPFVREFSFTVTPDAVAVLSGPDTAALAALNVVNRYRRQAGIPAMTHDLALGAAARRHAEYMATNDLYDHAELEGKPLYFGQYPWQRVWYFGYSGAGVAEDIHGISDPEQAIADWISGPYHREPILNIGNTEMGFGSSGKFSALEMGPGLIPSNLLVVWPAADQTDAPNSWNAAEWPNPLRLYPGTPAPVGYPISLQFAQRTTTVTLQTARLVDSNGQDVPVMKFSQENDDMLRQMVFIIPVKPMERGARYTVTMAGTVDYGEGAQPYSKTWSFATKGDQVTPPVQEPPAPTVPPTPTEPTTPPPPTVPVNLSDIQGHWAEANIRSLVEKGIVGGYPNGTFGPENRVTRGEFIKMLVSALNLPLKPGNQAGFTDMPASHWLVDKGYLGAAIAAKIVSGYPDGTFQPNRNITREEVAVMVVRALGQAEAANAYRLPKQGTAISFDGGATFFADADAWRYPGYVVQTIRLKIVSGVQEPNGMYAFRPAAQATRAEAAAMIARMLPLLK